MVSLSLSLSSQGYFCIDDSTDEISCIIEDWFISPTCFLFNQYTENLIFRNNVLDNETKTKKEK